MGKKVIGGGFEWDEDKASLNLAKHGVSFEEALTVFRSVTIEKSDARDVDRIITIGFSSSARILTVVTTETVGDRIRIISARKATPAEHAEFSEG